jgi:hypothetical protein
MSCLVFLTQWTSLEEELLLKNPNDEFLKSKIADKKNGIERRTLGFASIPGRTIKRILVDLNPLPESTSSSSSQFPSTQHDSSIQTATSI